MSGTGFRVAALRGMAALFITGADARTLLQGQLSADLRKLTPRQALLASCSSAQGRVQAVLTLLERAEGIVALLPASMVVHTVERLRRYVLRARVEFLQQPGEWVVAPLTLLQAAAFAGRELQPGECQTTGNTTVLRWWSIDARHLLLAPAAAVAIEQDAVLPDLAWRRAEIAAGIAQVYPETHESFIAQMLNLDALGGISFDKGCYTGQEIIARAQYRGTVKRRMYRYSATCGAPPAGTKLLCDGVHAGEVVDAVSAPPGCELLAVVSSDRADALLALDGIADSALTRLPLPYSTATGTQPVAAVQAS
jgi:folate-binding protein YgfZ